MKKLKGKIADAIVIGGGPAGISASIQLKRLGVSPILIEKDRLGGSLLNANLIENYLGFPKGISGQTLVALIKRQFKLNGIQTIFDEVKLIDRDKNYFRIITKNRKMHAKTVIVATGSVPKRLGFKEEDRLYGSKRLFYELKEIPTSIKGKKFVIIGGGDVSFDYAINLSKEANEITIICKDIPKCIDILMKKARDIKNVKLFINTKIKEIKYNKDNIYLICKGKRLFKCDYVIVAIGKKENIELLGKAIIKGNESKRESLGLFMAGDVKRMGFRQMGVAVGDGLLAAIKVKKYLDAKNGIGK